MVKQLLKGMSSGVSRAGACPTSGAPSGIGYVELSGLLPYDLWSAAHSGISAVFLDNVSKDLDVELGLIVDWLGLSKSVIVRKVRRSSALDVNEGERALGLARIVGMVSMADLSTRPDPMRWLGRWLRQPLPALGWNAPSVFLDTADGRRLVSITLAQLLNRSYA